MGFEGLVVGVRLGVITDILITESLTCCFLAGRKKGGRSVWLLVWGMGG